MSADALYERAMGMLGLCARARRLESGLDACVKAVRSGKACLVLMDAGTGVNSAKTVKDACAFRNVPLIVLEEGELSRSIGRDGRMVTAVTDKNMAQRFGELYEAALKGR